MGVVVEVDWKYPTSDLEARVILTFELRVSLLQPPVSALLRMRRRVIEMMALGQKSQTLGHG